MIKERHVVNAIVARRLDSRTTENSKGGVVSANDSGANNYPLRLLARVIYEKTPRSNDMKLQLCHDKLRRTRRDSRRVIL